MRRRMRFNFTMRIETHDQTYERGFETGYEMGKMSQRMEDKINEIDPTGELRKLLLAPQNTERK